MSKIPDIKKPTYNHNDKYRWVDSQWEKFMVEQKELKSKIENLENEVEELKQGYAFDMRNKQLEIISLKNQLDLFEDK